MLNRALKRIALRVPGIGPVVAERDRLKAAQFVPPGHFYSPVPSHDEVRERDADIFRADRRDLPGVDLNEPGQLANLDRVLALQPDWPFPERAAAGRRYYYDNEAFGYVDAAALHGLLRTVRPARVIEVGSGYSSAALLDTNDLFLGGAVRCTFVEPYPDRLYGLMTEADRRSAEVIVRPVQQVPVETFAALRSGDVLFIDSTHVSKVGSDVNYLFHEVLPALAAGVWVHVHDVFWPFEYPREWVYAGRSWNEDYLVRAFLQYNRTFAVELFVDFLLRFHADRFRATPTPPALIRGGGGGSLWLRKVS